MLTTIWLVLGALSFAAVMEHAGFLQRLLRADRVPRARRGSLIAAVNGSGIGLNVIAGDQYVADVLPARMFRDEFARRGLAPQVLSRAVEDSGTVTSVLVPWNTCGAYISGVLGVSTAAYFPFCFFNLLSPLLDVLYGFIGFKVPRPTRPWEDDADDRHDAGHTRRRDPWLTDDDDAGRAAAGFRLPSAYTILFALIVLMAIATWLVPAGTYDLDKDGQPRSRAPTTRSTRTLRGSWSTRSPRRSTASTASRTPRATSTTTTRARCSARSTWPCSSS